MKTKLIYLSILLIGFSASAIYGTGSIVTDTDISTPTVNSADIVNSNSISTKDLTVTGTCTGCGGGTLEGDFTSYTVFHNQTISGSSANNIISLLVSNNGTIFATDTSNDNSTIINPSGTIIAFSQEDTGSASNQKQFGQSITGKYKFFTTDNLSGTSISVFKNDVLLQNLGIERTQFIFNELQTASVSISPNGQYIVIYGVDSSNTVNREIIFKGS